ncbi:MAG: hypothetical protein VKM01_07940 [Cyanobacteriota bacterium]|nr:hypothetical protein [Cyanobacteriota bacterium]
MVSSCVAASPFSTPAPFAVAAGHRPRPSSSGLAALRRRRRLTAGARVSPVMLAALMVTLALLVAPEQPAAQEAICQRHNGPEACRVW